MGKDKASSTEKAYLYSVKAPCTNEVTVCASDSVFYPGDYVVYPTRFGLDLGLVTGNASSGKKAESEKRNTQVCGACHINRLERYRPEGQDGKNPAAMFEFVSTREVPAPETCLPCGDESGCWDNAFRKPVLTNVRAGIPRIKAKATPEEIDKYRNNRKAEEKALETSREKVLQRKLNMKMIAVHFMVCEPKALFFFVAEERVDFRALVKDLVAEFKMRIELRQIGVREEPRILGGLSVCGREFCCCNSEKHDSVTLRLAKEQNLPINSTKNSGACGRLFCCLEYEYSFYAEERRNYPSEGMRIRIRNDLYKVQEVNVLAASVVLSGAQGRSFSVPREDLKWSADEERWEVTERFASEFPG